MAPEAEQPILKAGSNSRLFYFKFSINFVRTTELLGHNDVRATMMYTHVLSRGGQAVKSLVDNL